MTKTAGEEEEAGRTRTQKAEAQGGPTVTWGGGRVLCYRDRLWPESRFQP